MNISLLQNQNIFSNALSISLLGFCLIGFFLIFGRKFKFAVQLERFGLPIAVISGIVGISIGPYGLINILSKDEEIIKLIKDCKNSRSVITNLEAKILNTKVDWSLV